MKPVVRVSASVAEFLSGTRVARLATVDQSGRPHVVPICYVYDGQSFFTAIDRKPKKVAADRLQRVRNILENSNIALVVDQYVENWGKLKYVMVKGKAKLLRSGPEHEKAISLLNHKYAQYRKMRLKELKPPVIKISPTKLIPWGKF